MSVMGFQKRLDRGVGWRAGGVSAIQFIWGDFWNFFNFAKPLIEHFWDQLKMFINWKCLVLRVQTENALILHNHFIL